MDQFMQALIWKAMPPIILASIGAMFLREGLQWLERKVAGVGRAKRKARQTRNAQASQHALFANSESPHCPSCNSLMVSRKAKKGPNAGQVFWGCPRFPACHGTRDI
jgi:hypothetical protein